MRTTDERGEFAIPAPPEEGLWIRATAEGFPQHLAGAPDVHVRPGEPAPRILLSEGGWIVGRVLLRGTGAAPDQHLLSLMPWDHPWDDPTGWAAQFSSLLPRKGEPLAPGEIWTPRLYPGRYLLEVGTYGFVPSRVEARVVPGCATNVGSVQLGTGFVVRGRVRAPGGESLGVVKFLMTPSENQEPGWWSVTETVVAPDANDAAFEITGAPDGKYELRVSSARYRKQLVRDIRAYGSTAIEIVVRLEPAAFVVLRVLAGEDSPKPSLDLRIGQPGGEWETGSAFETPTGWSLKTLSTDAEGRCRCGPLAPGRWPVEVNLRKQDGQEAWTPIGHVELGLGENPEVVLRQPR